jgi:hypothetical protein
MAIEMRGHWRPVLPTEKHALKAGGNEASREPSSPGDETQETHRWVKQLDALPDLFVSWILKKELLKVKYVRNASKRREE